MQNRQINGDDGRGMGEQLNEVDSHGKSIRVASTYYIDISLQGKEVNRLAQ